ncbi:potassium channel family protein [Mycoplasma sp. HS2188]|uniref:potassium channel family protein n=1 Tax=Mycoplasma sp. HS2188 TaxID=2976765 RepID=UPI0021A9DC0B|nr:potassium channel family protein [Mycoplasma sp. HS2188]MCT4469613.1 potassium channel family protein [Mycoplasma sp. HS2188]
MNKNTKNWNTFRNITEVIVTSSRDMSKIDDKHHTMTKILRRIYMITIFIVYFTSLSAIAADKSVIENHKFLSYLLGINDLLVIIIAIADFFLWFLISFKGKKPLLNLIKFPFSFIGILLILIMVPSINQLLIYTGFSKTEASKLRYLVLVRIIRLFFLLSYFKPFAALFSVFKKEKSVLIYTFIFIIFVILIFSIIFYLEEYDKVTGIFMKKEGQTVPDGNQFLKAIYFTTVTMTTIGYGDLTPATQTGRIMVIVLSLIGIAIFAIPSGVIAGGFIHELKSQLENKKRSKK